MTWTARLNPLMWERLESQAYADLQLVELRELDRRVEGSVLTTVWERASRRVRA